MNARTTQPKPENTETKKPKERSPEHQAATLAQKLGKHRAQLAKAKARVAELEAEATTLLDGIDPAVVTIAKRILGE